jgi:hypothetical protein
MTRLLDDILREPGELSKSLAYAFGQGRSPLPAASDLVLNLPSISAPWQFLLDILPDQLAAECLAQRNSQDCDSFRICSYIVEEEGGLLPEKKSGSRELPKGESAG